MGSLICQARRQYNNLSRLCSVHISSTWHGSSKWVFCPAKGPVIWLLHLAQQFRCLVLTDANRRHKHVHKANVTCYMLHVNFCSHSLRWNESLCSLRLECIGFELIANFHFISIGSSRCTDFFWQNWCVNRI